MATHTKLDPDTLRRVTLLFPIFLGLRLVPFGLWLMLVPLPVLGAFASWSHILLLVMVIAATWVIHRWYGHQYGTVQPQRLRLGRNWALLVGIVFAYAALGLGPSTLSLESVTVIVVLLLFATAVAFALPRAVNGGRRMAGLFLLVAAVGGVLLVAWTRDTGGFSSLGASFSLTTGMLLVLAGVIDHYLLKRTLDRAENER